MKLQDLFDAGITFQGDRILVKYWNNFLSVMGGSRTIVDTESELHISRVPAEYLNKEVLYIYQEGEGLVIEVGD